MSYILLTCPLQETNTRPQIATKFAPQPWRQTPESVPLACKASLKRLQQDKMTLYMQVRAWGGRRGTR